MAKVFVEIQMTRRNWYRWKVVDTDGKVFCEGFCETLSEAASISSDMYILSVESKGE